MAERSTAVCEQHREPVAEEHTVRVHARERVRLVERAVDLRHRASARAGWVRQAPRTHLLHELVLGDAVVHPRRVCVIVILNL
jgi:hypothetical protein